MSEDAIVGYMRLIMQFLNNEIDPTTFENSYLQLFKNEQRILPSNLFRILDGLFADVDAFCSDPALCGQEDLDEKELRIRCAKALKQLQDLVGPELVGP
jgi:hypothetical protein